MLKYFLLLVGFVLFVISCNNEEKDDAIKTAMTIKMHQKIKKISAELKVYCDSETYRKGKWKVDSILAKKIK